MAFAVFFLQEGMISDRLCFSLIFSVSLWGTMKTGGETKDKFVFCNLCFSFNVYSCASGVHGLTMHTGCWGHLGHHKSRDMGGMERSTHDVLKYKKWGQSRASNPLIHLYPQIVALKVAANCPFSVYFLSGLSEL